MTNPDPNSPKAVVHSQGIGRLARRGERAIRSLYVRWLRPHLQSEISQQRIKLLWFVFGYRQMFFIKSLSFGRQLGLTLKFLKIDWNVLHSHEPAEIAAVCKALGTRRGRDQEALLEAGCWNGGSSAKYSLICKDLDYRLAVFDSFSGVEQMTAEEASASFDFSGSYAASVESVRENIRRYGNLDVCTFHPGWFVDTLAKTPLTFPVRVAYIDCDVATGTHDALVGVVPKLASDGAVFSQDFHLKPVRQLLENSETWKQLHVKSPEMFQRTRKLVELHFTQ